MGLRPRAGKSQSHSTKRTAPEPSTKRTAPERGCVGYSRASRAAARLLRGGTGAGGENPAARRSVAAKPVSKVAADPISLVWQGFGRAFANTVRLIKNG